MGVSRSIARTHAVLAILVLVGCIALSSFSLAQLVIPKVRSLLDVVATKYDAVLPQITIRDGKASTKGKEPYFADLGTKEAVLAIDTKEGGAKRALYGSHTQGPGRQESASDTDDTPVKVSRCDA